MHAIFLTFDFDGDSRSLERVVDRYVGSANWEFGVVSSTWLNDGMTAGAFYLFQSVDAAERFLKSPNMRALTSHPDVSDFYVRHFSPLSSISSALPTSSATMGSSGVSTSVWKSSVDQPIDQPV